MEFNRGNAEKCTWHKYDESLDRDTEGRDAFLNATPEAARYTYSALSEGYIRLIELLPGGGYCPVRCRILEQPLSSAPEFEALSYYWGDREPPAFLSVYGCALPVTQNLKVALAYLRSSEKPRRLWVDAICINQNDVAEKASQVGIMRQIYQRAHQTVVWLGQAPKVESFPMMNIGAEMQDDVANLTAFQMCGRIHRE